MPHAEGLKISVYRCIMCYTIWCPDGLQVDTILPFNTTQENYLLALWYTVTDSHSFILRNCLPVVTTEGYQSS